MRRAASLLTPLAVVSAVAVAAPAGADRPAPDAIVAARRAASPSTLRLDGIGSLRLGMTRSAAYATGVLRSSSQICLDRKSPPVAYVSDGPRATPGVKVTAYFPSGRNSRLTHLIASSGATTELGIRPGVSTAAQMIARYRRAGYAVKTQWIDDLGLTLVNVSRRGRPVIAGMVNTRLSARRAPLMAVAVPRYFLADDRLTARAAPRSVVSRRRRSVGQPAQRVALTSRQLLDDEVVRVLDQLSDRRRRQRAVDRDRVPVALVRGASRG